MRDQGGSRSEAAELFPHYAQEGGTSPALLDYQADRIEASLGNLGVLDGDIETAERRILSGTAGLLQAAIAQNARPAVVRNIRRVMQTSLVAAGSIRLFAEDGVRAYDDLVDGLRVRYHERKAEIMASDCGIPEVSPDGARAQDGETDTAVLARQEAERNARVAQARQERLDALIHELRQWQARYREDPLEAQAALAASRLARGADDIAVLQELFAAGALPSMVVAAFPDVEFTHRELPYDIADMEPDEVLDHLLAHPGIAAQILPLLGRSTRREMIDRLVRLSGDPSFLQSGGGRRLRELAEALGVGDLDEMSTDGIVFALSSPDTPAEERERILRLMQTEYADLVRMPDGDLADYLLDHPDLPVDVRTWLEHVRPGALEEIAENWSLPRTHPGAGIGGWSPDVLDNNFANARGVIVGPDGRTYVVEIPQGVDPDDLGELRPQPLDMLADDGWRTIDHVEETIAQGGSHTGFGMRAAHAVAGDADPTSDLAYQSVGRDQEDYLIFHTDGTARLNVEPSDADRVLPASPGDPPTAPARWLPENQIDTSRPREVPPEPGHAPRRAAALGALSFAMDALEGIERSEIAENNRYFSVQTLFQENAAGERRAVVIARQVVTDGQEIRVDSTYLGYNEDGELSSYLRDEDGRIYEVDDQDRDD